MSAGELILYTTEDGRQRVQLKAHEGTVWLNQQDIAQLFDKSRSTIAEHIGAVFQEGELEQNRVCRNFRQTAADGKTYEVLHYNLDMILAVGYRVHSLRGTQFRRWATTTLREYLVKGFALDDERLKEPAGGWDYFDELLERIREIRASEKRFYQKVKDLFTLSSDYDPGDKAAVVFFQTIQNKMLWAVAGQTAAELIVTRADPAKPNMGLTSWQGGRVRKADIVTAKNYLQEPEIRELDRLVSAFLDLAEDRAKRRQQTGMQEWLDFADNFLKLAERKVLTNAGRVSHERMVTVVEERFGQFDTTRREAERIKADAEHDAEIETELKQIEKRIEQAKPEKKSGRRKKTEGRE